MSGGVDSSVAALLLQRQGHDVVAVFMRNGVEGKGTPSLRSCCSAADSADAQAVADRLGIPFYAIDYSAEFSGLIDHFAAEYRRGRTPNPCVLCNQQLKFGRLFELADAVSAEAVATGHYARLDAGRLLRARDEAKDQSYYLFGLDRAALRRACFPLGDLTKTEVRELATAAALPTADKPESMEICFVTSGDYRDVVREHGGRGLAGRFVDTAGKELGRHEGIDAFTVGQRRGLPALGRPYYVGRIDAASGDVLLVERSGLHGESALARQVNWLIAQPGDALPAEVKVRARSEAVPATLWPDGDDCVRIEFARPVAAITPGQAAVFYRGEQVLGGGFLD
jgi:tRNA-specific 2-thiouridylase